MGPVHHWMLNSCIYEFGLSHKCCTLHGCLPSKEEDFIMPFPVCAFDTCPSVEGIPHLLISSCNIYLLGDYFTMSHLINSMQSCPEISEKQRGGPHWNME